MPEYNSGTNQWEFREVDVSIDDLVISWQVDSEEEALKLVDDIQKKPIHDIDNKPWWIFHLIENVGLGESVVMARFHHAIGDGISLVLVMQRLMTDKDGKPLQISLPGARHDKDTKTPPTAPKQPSVSPMKQLKNIVGAFVKSAIMGISAYDSDLVFTRPNRKKCAMSANSMKTVYFPTLRLDFVKMIKEKAGATVNDVMLAATTGAIRRYCEKMGDPAMTATSMKKMIQFRALLPYAFPRPREEQDDPYRCMRNKWAFISVPLPMNVTSAKDRLSACNSLMNDAKSSPEAFVQLWLQDVLLSRLPTFLVRQTAHDIFSRQSLVFSNVPGPQEVACFAGEPIVGLQSMFPNILDQVLIVSYCGSMFMNMVVDEDVVSDIDLLKNSFLEEVKDLAKVYGIDTSDESKVLAPCSSGGLMSLGCNL